MKPIATLIDEIESNRVDFGPDDDELDAWIDERYREILPKVYRIRRDDAYARFVRQHIADYDPMEASDGEEPQPPCTCGNHCPVLRGTLPPRVEAAEDQAATAERWALDHCGDPHALMDADRAFRDLKAEVRVELMRLKRLSRTKELPEELTADNDAQTTTTAATDD